MLNNRDAFTVPHAWESAKRGAVRRQTEQNGSGVGPRNLSEVLRRAAETGLRPAGAGRRLAARSSGRARLRYGRARARHCRALARPPLHRDRFLSGNAEPGLGRALIDPLGTSGPAELD